MDYKYTIEYSYGEVANSIGCYTLNQAEEVAVAMSEWISKQEVMVDGFMIYDECGTHVKTIV